MGIAMSNCCDGAKNPFWPVLNYDTPKVGKPWKEHDLRACLVPITADTNLTVDVVVVGSGAGGGVTAAVLASAGYKVLVLEKGVLVPPHEVVVEEKHGFDKLYEKSGLVVDTTGAMSILAGSTFGGGTTINWGCCIPAPDYVRKEWADPGGEHRLPAFDPNTKAGQEYDESLKQVMARIGATEDGVYQNAANTILMDGCAKLGYHAKVTAQNYRDTAAKEAGSSCFGDRGGNKQGTMVTYLTDAAKNGAKFVDKCAVKRIVYKPVEAIAGERTCAKWRATGVEAVVDGHKLSVKATRCVVASAGSLHTPTLLLRSGFRNRHIGRHLHLHPVTGVVGKFHGKNVRAWEYAPMTSVSNQVEMGPKGDGYGAKLEVPSTHPGLMASAMAWHGRVASKENLLDATDLSALIVLQRDRGPGRVSVDPANEMGLKIEYAITPDDLESMTEGMDKCLRILAAAGADEVMTFHSEPHVHRPKTGDLDAFLARVRKTGIKSNSIGTFSAHQMGTCRMGYSPETSVVDADGETWEADNLYIADASVFPTASGSNPMVTTLTISHMTATKLAARLTAEDAAAAQGQVVSETDRGRRRSKAWKPITHAFVQYLVAASFTTAVVAMAAKRYYYL